MGSAILVPKVTPKAHPFFWSRGIEISRVALGTRMGKLRFSTDFTLSIPLYLCDVTAFFPGQGCMIEWGQKSTPKKSLGLPEKPKKSLALF